MGHVNALPLRTFPSESRAPTPVSNEWPSFLSMFPCSIRLRQPEASTAASISHIEGAGGGSKTGFCKQKLSRCGSGRHSGESDPSTGRAPQRFLSGEEPVSSHQNRHRTAHHERIRVLGEGRKALNLCVSERQSHHVRRRRFRRCIRRARRSRGAHIAYMLQYT